MSCGHPWEWLPAPVGTYLIDLTRRCHAALGTDLLAVYLAGSGAMRAYRPGRSDLDVVAVTLRTPDPGMSAMLVANLRHTVLPCPARKLELVLYERERLSLIDGSTAFSLELNDGPREQLTVRRSPEERSAEEGRFWYLIDLAILRDTGVALFGPPAAQLIGEPLRTAVLDALIQSLRWHSEHTRSRLEDVTLNAARALQWTRTGRWGPKIAAGHWLLSHALLPLNQRIAVEEAMDPRGSRRSQPTDAALELLKWITAELEDQRARY